MDAQVNTRRVILDILIEINEKGEFSNAVLKNALTKYQYLPHADRAFISRVVMGTVERKITIDYIIDSFSKVRVTKMKPVIRNILRMSVYQIIYMDSVKDFAACDEAVKLAVKKGFQNLKGFVNGVLRSIARQKEEINNFTLPPDIEYSTPKWITDLWQQSYGDDYIRILQNQYEDRPLSIRVNTAVIRPDELKARLEAEGVTVNVSEYLPEALYISGYDYLGSIDAFEEGLFTVQDISSMLVAHVAAPVENDTIIDLCAAPGGKSLHLAEMLKGTGKVMARDLTEMKVSLIEENMERTGVSNVFPQVKDATVYYPEDESMADIVICDLPCSGLGILNKKPDIKYQASPEKCSELAALQRTILDIAARYVKPGGRLIYSTCTLNPSENSDNAEWFLNNHDFTGISMETLLPDNLKQFAKGNQLEILPGVTGKWLDGFFISAFKRQ